MVAYKKYLKYFFIFTSLLGLSLLFNDIFISQSYENLPYKDIVEVH